MNLADLLKDGPRTADQLAKNAGVRAPELHRVLRALASVGVFAEQKDKRFKLTPLAKTLVTGLPGSMRDTALMLNADWQWDRLAAFALRHRNRRGSLRQGARHVGFRISQRPPGGPCCVP